MQPDKDEMMHLMRAGRFRENNGVTLNTINIVNSPERYAPLRDVAILLTSTAGGAPMSDDEVIKSVNFLQMAGYIKSKNNIHMLKVNMAVIGTMFTKRI